MRQKLSTSPIWPAETFDLETAKFKRHITTTERMPLLDLVEASQRYSRNMDIKNYDRDIVYYGGGLLARSLDRALAEKGLSLDQLWPALAARPGPITTYDFLAELENLAGPDLTRIYDDMINGRLKIE